MKNQQAEFEERVDRIVKKVIRLFRNYTFKEEPKLIAICENEFPADCELSEMFEDLKAVNLGLNFDNLVTYEKLLVVKSVIRTHHQLMRGELPVYGKILYYELTDDSEVYQKFDLNGKLMIEYNKFN